MAPPSFRAPWHPLLPALFVAAAVFVVLSSIASNSRNALYGTLLIGAGIPVFLAWARAGRRGPPPQGVPAPRPF